MLNNDLQVDNDEQWARAMNYINGVTELNYMTQIVIMMYEDPTKVGNVFGVNFFLQCLASNV